MSYPINPQDPNLPIAWQLLPSHWLEVAALSRTRPQGWLEAEQAQLEEVFEGWYVSHDFHEEWFDGFDQLEEPEEFEAAFEGLGSQQAHDLEQAVARAIELFKAVDFRKAEGLAKLFAGRSGGFLTPEQRQQLIQQIQSPPPYSAAVKRQAFLELSDGYAVAGVVFVEKTYPYYTTRFGSPINPLLTLLGREVALSEDYETELARGVLRLEGNTLHVGSWSRDFSGSEVSGTAFEEAVVEYPDSPDDLSFVFSATEEQL